MSRRAKNNPEIVNNLIERMGKTGVTVVETELIKRRRKELNLPEYKIECLDELGIILKTD